MVDNMNKIKDAPAPWTLNGQVAYLFVHGSRSIQESFNENPDPIRSPFRGGIGGMLLVRYTDSPVGPYDELLFFPGCYQFGDTTYYRISQIYVSSMDSVINGRRNWSVPKKLARFCWNDDNTYVKIFLPECDEPFCRIRVRPRLYCFPMSSIIIPSSFRTLLQSPLDEQTDKNIYLKITPTCSGWFRPLVELIEFHTDGKEIPSHEQLSLYTYGVGYEAFTLIFPKAEQVLY
ncbi:unnamed protein product [Rotaria sp. Silwood1]|nr:unnamed protein product [Rotaria sp. Silwood1]CAF3533234.1 unnamed protein product [Rotaria sp. Silwood1]CAF4918443.1 unnamed protein product [Rotaria sp. Silwood1]